MPNPFTVDFSRTRFLRSDRVALEAPKSIRHLPLDVETDLRQACSLVVSDGVEQDQTVVARKRAVTLSESRAIATAAVEPVTVYQPSKPALDRHETIGTVRVYRPAFKPNEASTRVDELMLGASLDTPSHVRTKCVHPTVPKPNLRPVLPLRGSSLDTTHSAWQSDVTDEQADSTGVTSAAVTPARMSKRASAHVTVAQDLTHTPNPPDLEEMRRKLEIHRRTREEEYFKQNTILQKSTIPARKPVRSVEQVKAVVNDLLHLSSAAADIQIGDPVAILQQSHTRASAITDRPGRATIRERASSRARSLSRGVKDFLRPSSRRNTDAGDDQRPGTAATTVQSGDARDGTCPPEQQHTNPTSPSAKRRRQDSFSGARTSSKAPGTKQVERSAASADLNRQLPPLPTLDTWCDRTFARQLEAAKQAQVQTESPSDELTETPNTTRNIDHWAATATHIAVPATFPTNATKAVDVLPPTFVYWPEMSATFCPCSDDLDFYLPIRTPSPISESSIRDRFADRDEAALHHSDEHTDGDDASIEVESALRPQLALATSISSGNLKAQLIHNAAPVRPPVVSDDGPGQHVNPLTCHPVPMMSAALSASNAKPFILLRKKTKKQWWKPSNAAKPRDWMTDVEQSGSRSGILLIDETASAPMVRY